MQAFLTRATAYVESGGQPPTGQLLREFYSPRAGPFLARTAFRTSALPRTLGARRWGTGPTSVPGGARTIISHLCTESDDPNRAEFLQANAALLHPSNGRSLLSEGSPLPPSPPLGLDRIPCSTADIPAIAAPPVGTWNSARPADYRGERRYPRHRFCTRGDVPDQPSVFTPTQADACGTADSYRSHY